MIFLLKSQPAPESLAIEKNKVSGSYREKDVLDRLKTDFKNKCYICEFYEPPSINVEHFKSHQGDNDKKFDWNNLFYSCSHCNNIKLHLYDDILNCTNEGDKIETSLHFKIDPFPFKDVEITVINNDPLVHKTSELLLKVYNGSTDLKTIEAENIRSKLIEEIVKFQDALLRYVKLTVETPLDQQRKDDLKYQIIDQLKSSSPFTAFKRWIIRDYKDDTPLKKEFIDYCK